MSQPFPFANGWEAFIIKEQLDKLVLQMYRSGSSYPEAVREFQKAFIIAVLQDINGNQVRAAKRLGMHRNTLRRNLLELDVDVKAVRHSRRRPPVSSGLSPLRDKKAAT